MLLPRTVVKHDLHRATSHPVTSKSRYTGLLPYMPAPAAALATSLSSSARRSGAGSREQAAMCVFMWPPLLSRTTVEQWRHLCAPVLLSTKCCRTSTALRAGDAAPAMAWHCFVSLRPRPSSVQHDLGRGARLTATFDAWSSTPLPCMFASGAAMADAGCVEPGTRDVPELEHNIRT